jgi:hypothetical protein
VLYPYDSVPRDAAVSRPLVAVLDIFAISTAIGHNRPML